MTNSFPALFTLAEFQAAAVVLRQNRAGAAEIDKTTKKIEEGIDAYDDLFEEVRIPYTRLSANVSQSLGYIVYRPRPLTGVNVSVSKKS